MSHLDYRTFYQRYLPHIQPPGATLFITFRLADSLPMSALLHLRAEAEQRTKILNAITDSDERARRAYQEQRRVFRIWDELLETDHDGPVWLRDSRIAALVAQSLHHRSGKVYDLDAFCIMPNHVHMVMKPLPKLDTTYHALPAIMQSLKSYTARQANRVLERQGTFWQPEFYDHVVRDEHEWRRIIRYVVYNPVKAGLAQEWTDWKWAYCRYLPE